MSQPPGDFALVPSRSPTRWLMLALLWLLYFSFGTTMGSIPPLVSPIMDDLGLTYGQMGFILGSWQIVYVVAAIPLGVVVDRLSVRKALGLGAFVVLLSIGTRGLSVDFLTLFITVALFGIGGPIISTGAPKLVATWFEGAERGVAAGIYTTGPIAGMTFAFATANSLVVPLMGTWRGISLVYGAVLLGILGVWWLLARDVAPSAGGVTGESPERPPVRAVLRDLLRLRNVQLVLLFAFGTFLLADGLGSWIPALLEERGMTLSQAGFWAAFATAAGALGRLTISSVATHGRRAATTTGLFVLATGATVGLAWLSGPTLITSLVGFFIARSALMPVLTLVLMETPGVGARRMGVAAGLFFTAAEIGGFGGAILLGVARDATSSLKSGVLVVAILIAGLTLLTPLVRERRGDAQVHGSDGGPSAGGA